MADHELYQPKEGIPENVPSRPVGTGGGCRDGRGPCAQYISNKRPSRFVILSETKDLARRTEILRFTQDDTPETASFDWQHVFFEMYWALCLSCSHHDACGGSQTRMGPRTPPRTGTRPPHPLHPAPCPYRTPGTPITSLLTLPVISSARYPVYYRYRGNSRRVPG